MLRTGIVARLEEIADSRQEWHESKLGLIRCVDVRDHTIWISVGSACPSCGAVV